MGCGASRVRVDAVQQDQSVHELAQGKVELQQTETNVKQPEVGNAGTIVTGKLDLPQEQEDRGSHTQKVLARRREQAKKRWDAVRKNLARAVIEEAKQVETDSRARQDLVQKAAAKFQWSGLSSALAQGIARRKAEQQAMQEEKKAFGARIHRKSLRTGLFEGIEKHENSDLFRMLKETYEQKIEQSGQLLIARLESNSSTAVPLLEPPQELRHEDKALYSKHAATKVM